MKTKNKVLVLLLMLFFMTGISANQPEEKIPDEIVTALKSGNARLLAAYFNQNVELVILNDDNVYSKAQAEQIVSGFFSQNQPEKFSIIHQGGKEGAKYVIGQLSTKQGVFRVYFLLKKNEAKEVIHQLRIDKQE